MSEVNNKGNHLDTINFLHEQVRALQKKVTKLEQLTLSPTITISMAKKRLEEQGYAVQYLWCECDFPDYSNHSGISSKDRLRLINDALNSERVTEEVFGTLDLLIEQHLENTE